VPAGELAAPEPAALELLAAGADVDGAAPTDEHADRPTATASAAIAVNLDVARGISMTSILPHAGEYKGRLPARCPRYCPFPVRNSHPQNPSRRGLAAGV